MFGKRSSADRTPRQTSTDADELAAYEAELEGYTRINDIDTTALPPADKVRGRIHGLESLVTASLHVMGHADEAPHVLDEMWADAQNRRLGL